MIERMKKITLLVSEKDRISFVSALRKAGVMHIRHVEEPVSHDIQFVDDRISRVSRMISLLRPYEGEASSAASECGNAEILDMEQQVSERAGENERLAAEIQDLERQLLWFDDWGEFDPADVKGLKDKGVEIRLFRLRKDRFRRIAGDINYKELGRGRGYIYLAVFGEVPGSLADLEESTPPSDPPDRIRAGINARRDQIGGNNAFLAQKAAQLDEMETCLVHLEKERELLRVKHGMGEEGTFAYLQGYCPVKLLDRIKQLAEKRNAGYVLEEPDDPAETPTLITNPKWINIIRPVFQFMNTLPGYDEFDISGVFLVFFSLFFAMLIGDAGYGIIFIMTTFLARKKMPKAPREPFFLMYLMGASTMIWGAVTGTWFGAEAIARLPGFRALVIKKIDSFGPDTQNFMIYLCFIIGAVQLTVAHLLRAARMINSLKALAQIGWALIVWGMFFAAGTLVVGKPFPVWGFWCLGGGIFLALLFTNPQKNIPKGIGATLAELPLSVISAFSDVVSYLRLFAVGYATVVLASTFNNMALGGGIKGVLGGFSAAAILFFGHVLNIALGMMAVVVHGIRLNMLEFSGHLGMQWTGRKYEPFKE